jgi:hypothetical protein
VTKGVGHGTLFVITIVLRLAYKKANYRPDERLLASVESLLLIEVIHVPVLVCAYRCGTRIYVYVYALSLDCKNAACRSISAAADKSNLIFNFKFVHPRCVVDIF